MEKHLVAMLVALKDCTLAALLVYNLVGQLASNLAAL
jgi:hypothetical protein